MTTIRVDIDLTDMQYEVLESYTNWLNKKVLKYRCTPMEVLKWLAIREIDIMVAIKKREGKPNGNDNEKHEAQRQDN